MTHPTRFVSATPVLASLDIERSVDFFCTRLGFASVHVEHATYGIVSSGAHEGPNRRLCASMTLFAK